MNKHTLVARVRDIVLETKLWILSWLILSAAVAASLYSVRARELDSMGAVLPWRDYMLARALWAMGLRSIHVAPFETSTGVIWEPPWRILYFWAEHWPPELLAAWDRDLHLIASAPLYAALGLAGVALIFSKKRS